MRRFAVVTTCHRAGFEHYGRAMVDSFLQHWPDDVPLLLYHEGFEPPSASGRIESRDLIEASPGLAAFKTRHLGNPRAHGKRLPRRRVRVGPFKLPLPMRTRQAPYRWDAVRFSHKTFAIFDAARRTDADVLVWIDADTRFFAEVDHAELDALVPEGVMLSCLRRPSHSECGFVAYNLRDPQTQHFLADFEAMYTRDLLFREREYHDSYLFDVVRARSERRGARVHDIGEGVGWRASHVLINSRLGRFMDHLKGDRKDSGTSHADDLVVEREESYWKRAPAPPA